MPTRVLRRSLILTHRYFGIIGVLVGVRRIRRATARTARAWTAAPAVPWAGHSMSQPM
jgi:hypothetical protein